VPTLTRAPRKDHRPVPMLAEVIDGVIGVDTHRDTHHAEIARPTGAPIVTRLISNDSAGYTQLLDWIFAHAPGRG
jgi:transposase